MGTWVSSGKLSIAWFWKSAIASGLVFGLLLLIVPSGCGKEPEAPNVLLISIDTLRADHLSSYGYFRETSPNLDALAARGVRFDQAWASGPRRRRA